MTKRRSKTIKVKAWTVLAEGKHLLAWLGGDGTRIPVWETGKEATKEAKQFIKNNAWWKPKLVPCTLTLSIPSKKQK